MTQFLHLTVHERKLKIVLALSLQLCHKNNMRAGKLIRLHREKTGISVRDLAAEIGVDYSMLSRFERGKEVTNRSWAAIWLWLAGEEKETPKSKN